MFDNIFTIRKFIGSAMFPLVFSLLPKRDKDTSDSSLFSKRYAGATTRPYRQLQSAWTSSVLQHIAVVETFPIAELKGRLFHYCKAILKKTQECGLQRDYKILHEVSMLDRRAAALPFLPLVKVMDYWLHIQENAPDREDCTKLTDYVTETCIEVRFSPSTRNHYQAEGPRTNSHIEGWHKLKKRVKIKLCDYWGIKEGAGSKWSKDVPVCNRWQEEKNSEEVSRGRRKTSASENSTDIWEKTSTSMAI